MYVELGKIVGVWGVKGWVKLHSYTRERADIANYTSWFLSKPRSKADPEHIQVLDCKEQAKGIVARLDGINDRDAAAALNGYKIWVRQSDLPKLPEGEFYWQQLIGLTVSNEQKEIGVIASILETGANDVLVCKQSEKGVPDVLIPYTDEVVKNVDIDAKTMLVDWDPDYLLEP